jgi:hypothetical protein
MVKVVSTTFYGIGEGKKSIVNKSSKRAYKVCGKVDRDYFQH